MEIKDKDFVWLCDKLTNNIEWGFLCDGHIILQSGGFEYLEDFNEDGVYDGYEHYFIGGFIRNATSFASAQAFCEHHLNSTDRFLDHHTKMLYGSASIEAEDLYRKIKLS